MANYTPIEQTVIDALEQFLAQQQTAGNQFNRTAWTRGIKEKLCVLGQSFGYEVCARECAGANGREWLYDMCWSKNDGDFLEQVGLILESEWCGWDLDPDFQKLVQGCADHRVYISKWHSQQEVDSVFNKCVSQVKKFQSTRSGDRYLIISLLVNAKDLPLNFDFRLYVHP